MPCSLITRPHLSRYQSITLFDISSRYLASRKMLNKVSSVWLFVKKTWSPIWRHDPKERLHRKERLKSAPVKVTMIAYLGQERVTCTRKLTAYLKSQNVEAGCLAC